jgi:hypothetical protein
MDLFRDFFQKSTLFFQLECRRGIVLMAIALDFSLAEVGLLFLV